MAKPGRASRRTPKPVTVASPERLQWLVDGFCTRKEAAELMGVDVRTVDRLIASDTAIYWKSGAAESNGAIRISRRWITEWISARLHGSGGLG